MTNKITIPEEVILTKIFLVRGQKVMLDNDLAELYQLETKQLKRQVRRNPERFPEDFMFELTKNEYNSLRSQFGTSSWGGTRYLPFEYIKQFEKTKQQKLEQRNRKKIGYKMKKNP